MKVKAGDTIRYSYLNTVGVWASGKGIATHVANFPSSSDAHVVIVKPYGCKDEYPVNWAHIDGVIPGAESVSKHKFGIGRAEYTVSCEYDADIIRDFLSSMNAQGEIGFWERFVDDEISPVVMLENP